jgi:hypothetical protein
VDIYTLEDESLGRDQVIDEYESLIWTERHIDPGEVQLVLPATEFNYQLIKPGTLLAHENSQELMLIDTRSVRDEDGMITNSGKSLETFLDERYNDAFEATDTPAGIMGQIVQSMIDRYEYMTGPGDVEVPSYLPGLMVGYLEPGDGQYVTEKVEYGPTYTNLMKIAQKYGLNFGLYRVTTSRWMTSVQTVPVAQINWLVCMRSWKRAHVGSCASSSDLTWSLGRSLRTPSTSTKRMRVETLVSQLTSSVIVLSSAAISEKSDKDL